MKSEYIYGLTFLLFCVVSCSTQKSLNMENNHLKSKKDLGTGYINRIDTLIISDSVFQIVEYQNGIIKSVLLINDKQKTGNYVPDQEIVFHDNGVLSEIFMHNSVEIDTISNDVKYQINRLNMSDKGVVNKALFMKDYKFIVDWVDSTYLIPMD